MDECEIHLNPPLTKVWARRGEPARVPAAGDDEKAAVFGAWDFRTGRLIWGISEKKNSKHFLAFLQQLVHEESTSRSLVLVMDNASYHRAGSIREFLQHHHQVMEVFWLPTYSPELNLIEYVWGYVKENVTNNYFFGQLERLIEATRQACSQLNSGADAVLQVNFKTVKYFPEAA